MRGVGERVKALIRELRYVLVIKHLNADATGSCYPTPSLELAVESHSFPAVIWVAYN